MKNRKTGFIIISIALFLWVVNRASHAVSDFVGKLFCASSYLQPVNGKVGDVSCGFNVDMYLTVILFWDVPTRSLFLRSKVKIDVGLKTG